MQFRRPWHTRGNKELGSEGRYEGVKGLRECSLGCQLSAFHGAQGVQIKSRRNTDKTPKRPVQAHTLEAALEESLESAGIDAGAPQSAAEHPEHPEHQEHPAAERLDRVYLVVQAKETAAEQGAAHNPPELMEQELVEQARAE